MAKKATETQLKPGNPVDGKITATASIEYKHPYEQNTIYHPTITLECSVGADRPLIDELMDDLVSQAVSAVDRCKMKLKDRLKLENQLHDTRARIETLKRQSDRNVSEDTAKSYQSELSVLEKKEQELLTELEAIAS